MPIVITRDRGVPRRLNGGGAPYQEGAPLWEEESDEEAFDPSSIPTSSMCKPDSESAEPVETPEAPIEVVDTTDRPISTGALLTLPFLAYLTLTSRLPVWARLLAIGFGASVLFGEKGLVDAVREKAEELSGFGTSRRRLRGYGRALALAGPSSQLKALGCGCGCNGRPGGCGA